MMNRAANRTIHLIECGDVPAIQSSELQVGMHLMWNYGSIYEVMAIRDASANFIEVTERRMETGVNYTRRLKKSRLVAGYWPKTTRTLPDCCPECGGGNERPCDCGCGSRQQHQEPTEEAR